VAVGEGSFRKVGGGVYAACVGCCQEEGGRVRTVRILRRECIKTVRGGGYVCHYTDRRSSISFSILRSLKLLSVILNGLVRPAIPVIWWCPRLIYNGNSFLG